MSVMNCKHCGELRDIDEDEGIFGENWTYTCSKCCEVDVKE